jgi:hypothetical protein
LALSTSWAEGIDDERLVIDPDLLVDVGRAVGDQAIIEDHLDVNGLQILGGCVVASRAALHLGGHLGDVEQWVDEVEPFLERPGLDLAEERGHAYMSRGDNLIVGQF